MKKSNIIVIALVSLIITSLLVYYIDGKNHGKNTVANKWIETSVVSSFTVVVVEAEADVHIIQNDTTKLKMEVVNDSSKNHINYKIINDTLHIYKGKRVYVYNKNITSIIAKKAFWVGVQFNKIDSMTFKVIDTKWFSVNNESTKCQANKLILSAQGSENISFNGNLTTGKLEIDANQSFVKVYNGSIKQLEGKVVNKSGLILYSTNIKDDIGIKKDSISQFSIYD